MIFALIYFLLLVTTILALTYFIVSIGICAFVKFKLEPVKGECKSNARLDNKVVLVTGGNQGIGLETARDLASRGARVIIACRDAKKSAEAIADIIKTTGNRNIEYKYLDLAQLSCVRKFAEEFNNTYDRLDILINNAGCAALKHKASEDGIDLVMQVNYLGPFLLTNLLLDKIKASPAARIIIVSSYLHTFARLTPNQVDGLHTTSTFLKYCNSKLCDVLWTKALAKRLPSNVTVNSLHPGVVKTDIFRRIYPIIRNWLMILLELFKFKTPKEGAQTSIYLAVAEEVAGVSGLGRTGVLIACYLVYSMRIRANDAIRLVRKKRPKSVQTSGQILCVQQFEHYLLPQTIVFSSKETLNLTKDRKTSEFTLKQYLYRQRATLHGLEERAFRELPKIIYCLCERLLKLCGCQQSVGLDFRIKNRPFYKNFMVYRLRKSKPPDPTTPEEAAELGNVTTLPMVEWRDPVEEDIERNLETVTRITGTSNNGSSIPAVQIHEAFTVDHNSLPGDRMKYLKELRNDINQQREAFNRINREEDPVILTGLLFEWLEGLKQPVLDREDLSLIVGRAYNVESCILALTMEDIMLLEYILRFVTRLRPLAANKKVDILKRFLASLTHQTVNVSGRCLPTRKDFHRLRDGTCSQVINFMLRMIVELQKDMLKPGADDADVVVPRRVKIKAWK